MNTQQRIASHAKHNPPSFDISMLNYVAPTVPHSLFLKSGPAPSVITTKAAWDTKVLDGLQDPNEAHIVSILVKIKAAFELLKTGHGVPDDYERLACAFNVALIRAEAINPLAEQTMLAGAEAMRNCDRIWQRHGRYGFTGPDLIAVADAIELYEGILRLSAPVLMEAAATEAARRMLEQAQGVAA